MEFAVCVSAAMDRVQWDRSFIGQARSPLSMRAVLAAEGFSKVTMALLPSCISMLWMEPQKACVVREEPRRRSNGE